MKESHVEGLATHGGPELRCFGPALRNRTGTEAGATEDGWRIQSGGSCLRGSDSNQGSTSL